ncbi:MAG TPA: hypothetical protein VL084_15145 [Thermoanaerobaculia bacterium]|nr:hypothetical protein [Thermoanaerobaculia bacterium]
MNRRFTALTLFLVAAALIAGPGAKLYAASPCNAGPPMACCGGEGDDGAPAPCSCSLSPFAPAPTVPEAATRGDNLAESPAPAPALAPPDPAPVPSMEPAVPRARAAPLYVLFDAFLN